MKIPLSLLVVVVLTQPVLSAERELREYFFWPLETALTGYQRFVSPLKSSRCSMYPSDSAYARQAVRRYGALKGTLLAIDRLNRCGHDARFYPVIMTADGPRLWDPLDPAAPFPR